MRLFISVLAALLIFSCAEVKAQSDVRVVQTCGTLPLAYLPGEVRPPTQDVNGQLCNSVGMFNGTTYDRQFTCASSAIVNVTAGNTTEIVALTGSQIIRVCSIAVSMSAAGTVTFTSGTGTNCGTGTTALSGAMTLATGTPLVLSGANGSLLRPAVSNAFCITAATGNVTGFITYAKY